VEEAIRMRTIGDRYDTPGSRPAVPKQKDTGLPGKDQPVLTAQPGRILPEKTCSGKNPQGR